MNPIDVLTVLFAAPNVDFRTAVKRAAHLRAGHPWEKTRNLERHDYEKHPHSNAEYVYSVSVRKCDECGLCYLDAGMSTRKARK